MTSLLLIGFAMVATSTQPAAAASGQAARASTAKDTRVICRRDDEIGTRLAPRVCLTRAQWRERDDEERRVAREGMEENARAGSVAPPTPAGGPG